MEKANTLTVGVLVKEQSSLQMMRLCDAPSEAIDLLPGLKSANYERQPSACAPSSPQSERRRKCALPKRLLVPRCSRW